MHRLLVRGFTLIELLVVIAIIAVLIAPLIAGGPGCTGSGAAGAVRQQFKADRFSRSQLPHVHRSIPDGRLEEPSGLLGDTDYQWGYGRWTGWMPEAPWLGYMDHTREGERRQLQLGPRLLMMAAMGVKINFTVYNTERDQMSTCARPTPTQVAERNNSYHASIGFTTYESPINYPRHVLCRDRPTDTRLHRRDVEHDCVRGSTDRAG